MTSKLLKGKKLTKELDQVIRDIFKEKYKRPYCFVDKKFVGGWFHPKTHKYGIQVGHFISRRCTFLRWELKNLFPQCSSHNMIHNQNPAPFTLAIIKEYGISRIEYLEKVARESRGQKMTDGQKRSKLVELQEYLETLRSAH